jgi:RNA polymerase sigma-70 factor (ECF subfamily)
MSDAESQRTARFDELFRACVADIAAYCRWRTRSFADADDALAEVFLVAWRRLDDVPASAPEARVWLYATARRVTANQHRAARRRMGLVDRIVQSRNRDIPAPTIADGPDAQRVRAALAQRRFSFEVTNCDLKASVLGTHKVLVRPKSYSRHR